VSGEVTDAWSFAAWRFYLWLEGVGTYNEIGVALEAGIINTRMNAPEAKCAVQRAALATTQSNSEEP